MRIVNERGDLLGESPSWMDLKRRFYWVDIPSCLYHFLNENMGVVTMQTPDILTSLYPDSDGSLMGTMGNSFIRIDPESSDITELATVKLDKGTRFNDGKCDRNGNYWAGTMDVAEREPIGKFFVLNLDGKISELMSNITISNGICWNYDTMTFYHIDTPTKVVRAFDFKIDRPEIWNPRVSIDLSGEAGVPDGMTIDEAGNLWIAHWGGSHISVWNPVNMKKIGTIKLPANNITSCSFDGKEETRMLVTSARSENRSMNYDRDLGGSTFLLDRADLRGVLR